jgi:hypothetical protein
MILSNPHRGKPCFVSLNRGDRPSLEPYESVGAYVKKFPHFAGPTFVSQRSHDMRDGHSRQRWRGGIAYAPIIFPQPPA